MSERRLNWKIATWALGVAGIVAAPGAASAQSLGTFRWQLQPYCNVLTVTITQVGGAFRLEGTDDQCGTGAGQASALGTAFPNPDGTIGFGLSIVSSPGGTPVHVHASVPSGAFTGTWTDDAGASGTFAFTQGAGTGGQPRPAPARAVPSAIRLQPDGGFLAAGSEGQGTIPASGSGTRAMWHPAKAAFRAGTVVDTEWDDANVGRSSTAFGWRTVASGMAAFAAGDSTVASGGSSTAFGQLSRATGFASTALGSSTTASGLFSTAMGSNTTASGSHSTAMGILSRASNTGSTAMGSSAIASGLGSVAAGLNVTSSGQASVAAGELAVASGARAVALGHNVTAAGNFSVVIGANAATSAVAAGSVMFADASFPTNPGFQSLRPNEFMARAAGGYWLYSNAALTSGVRVAPGASAWSSVSDVNAKENFRELSGDDILTKIARLPVREWNYRTQDAAIRHVGPTAQDFHAAFGLGEDELRISTIDADGITLAAVKALEARTSELQRENDALRARMAELERRLGGR